MRSTPGQPVKLLKKVFMEPQAVHEHPKHHQSGQRNVHIVLLALALHTASAIGADIIADLRAGCKHSNFWSAHMTLLREGGRGEGRVEGQLQVQP